MKKTLLMFSFLMLMGWTYAQNLDPSVIASGGGIHSVANISLEWTLGETAVGSILSENHLITEGYHQPVLTVFETDETTLSPTLAESDYQIIVFPNPVKSLLSIQAKSIEDSEIFVSLINMMGKQSIAPLKKNSTDSFEINLSHLPSGIYMLRFRDSKGQAIKTFKISKIR